MRPRSGLLIAASIALWVAAWTPATAAGPGSGTAIITPSGAVPAGTSDTWSIQFTAEETMEAGRVRITIPAGWTAPQSTGSSSAGYVTVSTNEPAGVPLLSTGGQVVTIDIDTLSVGNTITLVYGNDAGGASARATAASVINSYTFQVASDPSGTSPANIGSSPGLNVIAGAPAYIEIAPSDTTAIAGTFVPYRFIVRDDFGNRAPVASTRTLQLAPAHGQFFNPANHGTVWTTVQIASGTTSARADYKGTMATPTGSPHSIIVFTTSGTPALGGSDVIHIDAAGLSTSVSTISATSPVTANGTSLSSVTVTAKDAFGNPREGDSVVLGVTGSAVENNPGGDTDENGEAVGAVTNMVAEVVTVSATINGQALTSTDQISFTAGAVDASNSLVTATTPVIANGVAQSTITVTARDANGNPIAGQTVTLSILPVGSGAVLTQPGGVTNASGIATGTLSSTTTGNRTVSAVIGSTSITDNAVVVFNAGAVASFEWSGIDGAAVAGVPEQATLTAKDAQGNVITNYTGTVSLTTNSTGVGDGVVQWSAPDAQGSMLNQSGDNATYTFHDDDDGVATLRVTDTKAETIILSATAPAVGSSSAIVVGPGSADEVQLVAGNAQSATVNTAVATPPKVRVVDAFDNVVPGATVTFTVLAGGGSRDVVAGGGADASGPTASDGTIDCDVWTLGTDTGDNPNQLRASIVSGSTPNVDFSATATAGPGDDLVLTPGSKNVTVNSNEQVTATLRDQYGNLKSGEVVTVAIKSGTGTLVEDPIDPGTTSSITAQARQGTTDSLGKITVRYVAPSTAGLADVLDGSTPNVAQSAVTDVTYTTTASGATQLRITFVGSSTQPAGTAAQFTIEAVDGIGNRDTGNTSTVTFTPEASSGLQFSLTNFGATITSAPLIAGVRTIYVRGTLAGTWDITTTTGGLGQDVDQLTVTDTGVIDHYDVSTVASVVAGVSFNVSVSARDQYDNLVDGANNAITLEAIDDVTTGQALDDLVVANANLSSGQATVAEQYTNAEAIRVRVSNAGKEGVSGVLTVSAAAAKRITKVTGDGTGIAAGSNRTLTAHVVDAYDNPVSGSTVFFLVLQGGGSVLPASTPSLASGNASTTLTTGAVAGDNRVRASILDGTPPADEQVEFSVVTTAGGIAYFTVVPQTTSLTAGQAVPLTITAYDAGNNVVSSDNTTQVSLSSSTGNAQFGSTTGTLTSGVFATTLRNDVVQSFTVTAEEQGGGPPSGTSVSISVTNAGAYQVYNTSGNGTVTAGANQNLQATVRDQFNNLVPGALVTFSVLSAPDGTAFFTDADGDPNDGIAVANGSGVAQVTYHTAQMAGTNSVNAQILDGSPAAREKVTFTVNTTSSGATKLRITFLGPSTVAANQSFSFKVEALDASDNLDTSNTSTVTIAPESGSLLVFSETDFGGQDNTYPLVAGTKTIFGRSTLAGNWDITASAGGLTGDTDAVTVTHTGTVASYFVTAAASAAAGAPFTVDIEARDTYGNKVTSANNIVNLIPYDDVSNTTPTGLPFTVTQATLVSGAVVVNESYLDADLIRVRVHSGSVIGFSGVVSITPAGAHHVINISGDSSGSIVAGATRLLTARVLDQYDNPVQGQLVSFSVTQGGGSTFPLSNNTNAAGDVTTTLTTGTTVGTNIVRATILDGAPAALETDDFTVSTIAGPIANYEVTPVKTSLVANEITNVTIKARDANGNYRTQDNTTDIVISATGDGALGATSGQLTAGQFTTTVRDTTAQTFTVTATTQGDTENGTSPTITVTNGPAYRIVYLSGSGTGVPAGIDQFLRTEVRDQWSNTVASQPVRYQITVSPPGSYLRDAVGDSTDGITASVANGKALARMHLSPTVGSSTVTATILDGTPTGRERVTFNITTVSGGIAYYTVQMNATSTTAGVSKTATITAYDIDDNVVNNDVQQVVLAGDPGNGLVFGANPVQLNNGVATTSVTANLVQTYNVRASSQGNPSVTGLGPDVTVVPAPPTGPITATATQNTITANGTSTTTITSGVIRDAFTNQVVQGLSVNVTANIGGVIVGGSPKTIGADGRIVFDLRSSTTVATCTVTMTSAGAGPPPPATGTIPITFAARPNLICDNAPTPGTVVPGSSVSFSVSADNTSVTGVNLTTATTFTFTDGTRTYSANLSNPQSVPGSGTTTLVFDSAPVHASFINAGYAPVATLIGTDAHGSPVNIACTLPASSLVVTSIEIMGIVPASPVVSRGYSSSAAVTVRNNGSQTATISDVDLDFIPNGLITVGNAPELGQTIGAGASKVFNVPFTVQAGANEGPYQIDAVATGTVGGQPVTDDAVAPHALASIDVTTAANLSYENGTMIPQTVSRGDLYAFQLTIRNQGGGLVQLDSALTRLTFTDGTRTYNVGPSQPYAIPGDGATQSVNFRAAYVPANFSTGSRAVTLTARGTENGASFTQIVSISDPVVVQSPADVTEAGADALNPDTVSKTTTAAFTVNVQNSGQATVVLTPGTTTIKFSSNQYSAALNATGPVTLPQGTTTLQFLGATVSNAIPMQNYNPVVQLTGFENGNPFSKSITLADQVSVQNPPAIAILDMDPTQDQFTADQTPGIQVRMIVSNTSAGAGANFSSASLRFIHAGQDRTGQFIVSTPSSFTNGALLSPGETDQVVFNVSDNSGNAMTPGNMTIEGTLVMTDVNTSQQINVNTDAGGKGNLMVMTPAAITFDSVTPSQTQVTQNMSGAFKTFQVHAVVRNTGGSDAVLSLPATDLQFAPAPGWVFSTPTLAGGGSTLSGGEVDELIFNVTTSGSTPGPTSISVVTSATETNSGRVFPGASGPTSVLVETPGSINIVSVVPSQPSITAGTTLPWTVTVTLSNPGESDVDLALGTNVSFSIQSQSTPPAFVIPGALAGGGTLLSGGETDQLVIPLTTSGTYSVLGNRSINFDVDGTELNSGVARNGNDTGTILVQQAPDANFVSLTPPTVSKLTNVAFAVNVTNPAGSNRATLTLDRSLTRLQFGANQYNVGLTQASPVDIAPGATVTLQFASATVGAGIPPGVQNDSELELHWTHNGVTAPTKTIDLGSAITVENAPSLSILSVRPSKTTLTQNQSNAGTVTMVVRNSGGAAVDLDLSSSLTYLGFKVLGSGATVTSEYIVQQPTALEAAGGIRLSGGATDSLVFDLTNAGTTAGSIIVNGYVGGTDLNSSLPVSDDTFSGGSGSLQLQLAGALSILSITPGQPTATVGQTAKSYPVKMAVRNTGGAAINVNLLPANSLLSFTGSGWAWSAATMPNGATLSGGETDTLRFTVTTTGGPAGIATIGGTVSGTENNTGDLKNDNTLSGGTGAITLQTPANLIVDSVTPSQAAITASTSADWTTTIALHNAGQSDARIVLPAGLTISIQHATGGTTFVKPLDLEEGGVILSGGASGTLVVTTTATGTFSSFGPKTLNVTVGATELNSNRALSPAGAGTIAVQQTPNLTVLAVRPTLVTRGTVVDFEVDVRNPSADNATVHFNRGTTRVHFASSAFSAFLDPASADSVAGGATTTLRFEGKLVPASIAVGQHNFNVVLAYDANLIPATENEVITNGITIQAAPQLFIQQIQTSQTSVTAGQTADWTATMTVVNNGASNINLDLSAAKTFLTFIAPGGGPDNSYQVSAPVKVGGGSALIPSEVGQILFTVTQTGTQTGNVVISGKVEGHDATPPFVLVTDDTFDGGRGGIVVQSAPGVVVSATHTSQPQVTLGQTGWAVRVVVANTGGADVNIDLGSSTVSVAGAGWTFSAPVLQGGGNTLEGGTVDSLLFTATAGPGTVGSRRIDATVPWTEVNTSTSGSAGTATSGFGNIVVESRAALRITTTTVVAPNPASVNLNQPFSIAVQIQNTGGADARNVVVGMTTNSASAIQSVPPLAVLPGGQTVSYSLPVIAASAADPSETFTTTLASAIDENSGQGSLVTLTNPPVDATAALAIETPADILITNVRPSQATVTRGQANPWNVIVRLRNTGQADAVLTPPVAGDIDFSLAGSTKIDYAVQPPSQFGSGAAGWTLAGGATDSLIYSVVDTGNDPGTVDIAVATAGTDLNDPAHVVGDTGATTVNVQDVAGLFIATTVPVGTHNHASAARDTVNTNFAYQIHVTVQNSGGEAVDSVRVQLASDGGIPPNGSLITGSQKRESIAAGATRDFIFNITSRSSRDLLETFSATILPGVKSHNSGQTVIPQPPVDNQHSVVIQTPADLSMNLFVASPPGSAGGVVGTNQLFTLGARVSNLPINPPLPGTANVTGLAEITLTVPAGFSVQENPVRVFAPDDTVKWTVTAPGAIQSAQDFTCAITTTPIDVNSNAPAAMSKPSDIQSIVVSSGGALASPSITISSPPGAVDDTLSVGQQFIVTTEVTVSRVKSLVATLEVPAGFDVVGSNVHNFANAAGTRTRNFTVNAPLSVQPLSGVFVTFTAQDTITGGAVPSASDTVRVLVVPRTSLSVAASVTAPPEAIDNTVATGAQFTVTASVANAAGAAGIAAPGSLQITMPVRYTLGAGETAQKPFVVGMPVSWVVNASAQPSGPDQISVSIVNIPADENSGTAAQVTTGTATIAMVTEGSAVSVRDVSSAQSVGTGVAPAGADNLDVLAFEIAYNVTDTSVNPAVVDTIALTILDKDGRNLGPGVVSQTLARLAVNLGGPTPYEVTGSQLNANPVIIPITGTVTDHDIAPDGSIIATVFLDLDASPRATEIRVRVSGGGLVVRDPGSGPLAVTDTQGRPLDGQITSGPLVVLSSNFEEYAHNAPNPFRAGSGETRITYFLDAPANVSIQIFDITGALVYEEKIPSSDPRAQTGPQAVRWDGRNMKGEVVRNGIYVCALNAGSHSAKIRIAVAK